ncbi:protein sey1 [Ceraceosorus bombacis]|uniref:Protein sey1 n=1 Tax=Ceraceosorus bombacis TaxID=401625 RepID=A0A0P1BKM7_9BASI|nr:protein sey1 [Ceraceosorus bombacis]
MAETLATNGVASAAASAVPIVPVGGSDGASGAGGVKPTLLGAAAAEAQPAERMHLINEEQKFTPDLTSYLAKWNLIESGFGYNLCAVLGSQSTGKSTLLNRLFGTSFDVMDETRRQQTTKGIWLCRALQAPLLVMDVEGTDGRERGEDQDFERKSALFSMASAECLIVNMWEIQVGLYQGANMGLLKTVFEVNLGLFQSARARSGSAARDKTLLFFVIRDHIGVTPLENLKNTLLHDLGRIWDSLSKPEGLESSQITDFFDFDFTTLPHKVLQPDEFEKQVVQLRERFVERNNAKFVFRPEYHKRIPADGLPMYLGNIWEQVMTNKDLDLPTQQELLAQFRCDEIAGAAFTAFTSQIRTFRKPIEAGSILETLGEDMGAHRGSALAKFDKDASRYHQEVYKRKRVELLDKLNAALSPFFLGQLKNLHKVVLATFRTSVLDRLRGENYDFAEVVQGERAKALSRFAAASLAIRLSETDWTTDEEQEQLREAIDGIADQCRADETKKMVAQIERGIKKITAEPTELALARPGPDMWDRILIAFKDALTSAEAAYLEKAKSFNCTDEENAVALSSLRRKSWQALRAKIDEQTADAVLSIKLRSVFEDRFRYDDEGVPRVWKPDDDIDGVFRKARDETLALIPVYARIEPSDPHLAVSIPSTSEDPAHAAQVERGEDEEFDFPSSLVLFTETRKADVSARFRKEADAYYVEAKRSTVSSIAQVPVWMYGVMVALGWNEFLAVVRSPLYFTFLLLLIASAYDAAPALAPPIAVPARAPNKAAPAAVEEMELKERKAEQ